MGLLSFTGLPSLRSGSAAGIARLVESHWRCHFFAFFYCLMVVIPAKSKQLLSKFSLLAVADLSKVNIRCSDDKNTIFYSAPVAKCAVAEYIMKADGGIPEWLKGADCKSASIAFGGSNPPPTTI